MLESDETTNDYETEEDQRKDDVEWASFALYAIFFGILGSMIYLLT